MCLVALAIDQSRRFPLVVAANRDEFFGRPTARLSWWTSDVGGPPILAGRDLEAGGTWLGLTAEGRLALVTNVRRPGHNDPAAPSRGQIVPQWLGARDSTDRFWVRTAMSGYNGFNLVAVDFRQGECFFASNMQSHPMRLERGVHGLSNATLNTPWPKVEALKARVNDALVSTDSLNVLATRLFDALSDRSEAPDEALPETGLPLEAERRLSAAFIRPNDRGYGTRCSTLVIAERVNRQLVTHVLERSFNLTEGVALLRRSTLKNWPPRYSEEAAPSEQGAVSESEVDPRAPLEVSAKRVRVRSLLKPDPSKRRRRAGAAQT